MHEELDAFYDAADDWEPQPSEEQAATDVHPLHRCVARVLGAMRAKDPFQGVVTFRMSPIAH